MISKTVLYAVIGISLFAVSGIAYATFTSSITINGTATAGTLNLYVQGASGGTGTYSSCSWSNNEGSSITLTVSNLSPGDSCSATATIENSGSLPSTSETSSLTSSSGPICTSSGQTNCFEITDNMGLNSETGSGGTSSSPIDANNANSFTYVVTVSMPAGSTQQGISASFTITFTGSVGS
jgi:hypothetical protein